MSLSEISAAQQIMKLAITGQQHLDALVGYYRSEIDKYNQQRIQWALHYQNLKNNAEDKHSQQRELQIARHRNQVIESQLNTIKAQLNQQRNHYFDAYEQNKAIKQRAQENKKKFRDIIAQRKPIPLSKVNKQQNIELSPVKSQLELQLINMTKTHEAKKNNLKKQINNMKQSLQQITAQHSNRGGKNANEYARCLQLMSETQNKIMKLTSQYFKLRMQGFQQQRKTQEENQILRLKIAAAASRLQNMKQSHKKQFLTVQKDVKSKNTAFKIEYDEQLRKKQQHLSILKQQHDKINDVYILKLKRIQQELVNVQKKQVIADQRYRTEINSLRGQIKVLTNRLQRSDNRQMRAQIAESQQDSSLTMSASELDQINKQVQKIERRI